MSTTPATPAARPVRLLIVDDSAMIRKLLIAGLEAHPQIEVVGAAADPYAARDLLVALRPDVITLDIEMPRMSGLDFLRKYMPVLPTPTLILSSLANGEQRIAVRALEAGAVDVVPKSMLRVGPELTAHMAELAQRIAAAARVDVTPRRAPALARPTALDHRPRQRAEVIVVGASTGGVHALAQLLPALPPDAPPVVVVQHMPAGFTTSLADRLDEISAVRVREVRGTELLRPGEVLLAPAVEQHLELACGAAGLEVRLVEGERVSYARPSVDVLFASTARAAGARAVGVILTGMGSDGAQGLLDMRRAGARTLAQDEASSVVFGMPKAAWQLGAAEELRPLTEIAPRALALAGHPGATTIPDTRGGDAQATAARASGRGTP